MAQDLKQENSKSVFLIMAASLACSALIQIDLVSIMELGDLAFVGVTGLMLSVVLVMLANLVPQDVKHKLIFLRFKNEMPACRIHELCRNEPRIEFDELELRWPDIFGSNIDGAVRNKRWYQQIYKLVSEKKEVRQAHRNFLLYRDAFSGLLLILLATLIGYLIGDLPVIGTIKLSVIYVQLAFVTLTLSAANIAGKRFVVNTVVAA